MSAINPREQVLSIIHTEPGESPQEGALSEKVAQISGILQKHPELKEDQEITSQVLDLTKGKQDVSVRKFRNEFIKDVSAKKDQGIVTLHFPESISDSEKTAAIRSCPSELGRFDAEKKELVFTEKALEKQGKEQLWKFIEEKGVTSLVIQPEGIEYNQRVLKQLLQMKPMATDLAKNYTLEFDDEKTLEVPKAKLLLCGSYLEGLLEDLPDDDNKIDFTDTQVTNEAFQSVLSFVETGEKDEVIADEVFETACAFLDFKFLNMPEGVFGPEQWMQYYDYPVDDVPPVPDELLASLSEPSPFFEGKTVGETSKLFLVPKGVSLSNMGNLAQNAKEGHKLNKAYEFIYGPIQERYGDQKTEESYWVLMTTDILPDSRSKTREEQLALASREEGYEAPSLLEAAVLNFLEYVSSGKHLFGLDPWTHTCCKEEPINGSKLDVGGFGPGGLQVYYDRYDDHTVGVAGVFRK